MPPISANANISNKSTNKVVIKIAGYADSFNIAYQNIESILFETEEIKSYIMVNLLLANSGTLLKETHSEISKNRGNS